MIASLRIPRFVSFWGLNAAALLLLMILVVLPLLSHFQSRSDEISENSAQLAHLRNIARQARTLEQSASREVQPFLAGKEERVVSADLQASLQSLATAKGARILGMRGLQGGQIAQLRTVAVGLDIEVPLSVLRDTISAIETQTPFLFVREVSLRALVEGDDGAIRAELKVEGVVRGLRGNGLGPPPVAVEDRRRPELADAVERQ